VVEPSNLGHRSTASKDCLDLSFDLRTMVEKRGKQVKYINEIPAKNDW
jgi:hypothetical protein